MEQVCSRIKCSEVIAIQEGRKVAMFDGKPLCQKCASFFYEPLPSIPRKTEPVRQKPYEESKAYKKEVINDGRDVWDYPAHLPIPTPGFGIRRIQAFDEEGGMQYKYIRRPVDPKG
ncbi:uncharacterized protein EDB93DRAFT_1258792 [Suillus bovinus]|uniref:uncharacterized protein n=1 Tax=Suillus bovinus TaxID=48563 RepID=UPI001B85D6F5|nr:uncharacterized protein EDB93DRAFT_1258792 [Suillus bovinus]KAG2124408.1 hypothetical protein EDB93DRAFT_1258792 [Suillus bovinus]